MPPGKSGKHARIENMGYNFLNNMTLGDLLYLKNHKSIIVVGAFILLLTLSITFISVFWPKYEERFFEFGLLGKDATAEAYYPNDNSTLNVDSNINWHIYLYNHMGSPQNVIVRVKLLNSTLQLPDNQQHTPSPLESFAEFPLFISVDDTTLVPFSWSISEVVVQNGSTILKTLTVNNEKMMVDVSSTSNSFFHMVFELWVYDQSSQKYSFEWENGKDIFSASLQMAFKLTSSVG